MSIFFSAPYAVYLRFGNIPLPAPCVLHGLDFSVMHPLPNCSHGHAEQLCSRTNIVILFHYTLHLCPQFWQIA